MMGEAEITELLQSVGKSFELSQQAAEKLIEDTMTTNTIVEILHALGHY